MICAVRNQCETLILTTSWLQGDTCDRPSGKGTRHAPALPKSFGQGAASGCLAGGPGERAFFAAAFWGVSKEEGPNHPTLSSRSAAKIIPRGMEEGSNTQSGLPSVAWRTMATSSARAMGPTRAIIAAPTRNARRRGNACVVAANACLARLPKPHLLRSTHRLLNQAKRIC